ncbi:MAG: hypothetical protein AAB486_04835 [Patescibacteria group bacterium]
MKITLTIIRVGDELLFRAPSGQLFDCLTAHKLMANGRIDIVRRNRVFDTGKILIDDDSRSYPHCAFLKLGHLYSTNRRAFDFRSEFTRIIAANDLREKDRVIITMPRGTVKNFNFDRILRSLWKKKRQLDALAGVLAQSRGHGIGAGKLAERFGGQLAKQPKEKLPTVPRFLPELIPSGTSNLPTPVRKILRWYLNTVGEKGRIRITAWRGPVTEGKHTFFIVDTDRPTLRSYHVFPKSGAVADKGCGYAGRWDGQG